MIPTHDRQMTQRPARRHPHSRLRTTALAALLCAVISAAHAQAPVPAAMPKPAETTEIVADEMQYDTEKGVFLGDGNAEVVNGEIRITSDRIVGTLSPETNKVESVEVTGHVVITHGESRATANKATYDLKTETIVLTGDPKLDHGPHNLTGAEEVTYSVHDGIFRTKDGRVRLQLKRDADANELIKELPLAEDGAAAPIGGAGGRQIILADSLEFKTVDRLVNFTGDVQVDDADMTLHSQSLAVHYGEDNQVTRITANKSVRAVRGDQIATAETADYDVIKGYLEMTGNPILEEPRVKMLDSDRIEYVRSTGKFKAVGRPKVIFKTTKTTP